MATWNPDSGSPLTHGAITCTAVEKSSLDLWEEFLGGWFDGTQHMLRGAYVTLPKADGITFQDTALPSALDGLYITVTTERPMKAQRMLYSDAIWMISERAKVSFWFRAHVKARRIDGHNSQSLVQWGADTLYAILQSPILTAPLTRRGMGIIRPQPPILIGALGAAAGRMLSLNVNYVYSNQETDTGTATPATIVETDLAGSIVYLGHDRKWRIGSTGDLERVSADGKSWNRMGVEQVPAVGGGTVPAVTVEELGD